MGTKNYWHKTQTEMLWRNYLTGLVLLRVYAVTQDPEAYKPSDNVVTTLKMANGSIGSITYVAGGDKAFPWERVEVFGGGAVGLIDNFRKAVFVHRSRRRHRRGWLSIDRGHRGEIESLLSSLRDMEEAPVNLKEYIYTTLATFAIEKSLKEGMPIQVKWER